MTGESYPRDPQHGAVAVVQEQIALWLGQGLSAEEAWFALRGEWPQTVSWAEVRGFMIGWWLKNQLRGEEMPLFRRAA